MKDQILETTGIKNEGKNLSDLFTDQEFPTKRNLMVKVWKPDSNI